MGVAANSRRLGNTVATGYYTNNLNVRYIGKIPNNGRNYLRQLISAAVPLCTGQVTTTSLCGEWATWRSSQLSYSWRCLVDQYGSGMTLRNTNVCDICPVFGRHTGSVCLCSVQCAQCTVHLCSGCDSDRRLWPVSDVGAARGGPIERTTACTVVIGHSQG